MLMKNMEQRFMGADWSR